VRKRVAVIGAGLSGLVTVKELLELGLEVRCYERAAGLGGVFRFGEDDGVLWETCRMTSSGLLTAFSDFPVDAKRMGHMHASEYVRYLEEYCQAFGILDHVAFGHCVQNVTRGADGRWKVSGSATGIAFEQEFDAVAVCSGLHQHPHVPAWPGMETFEGTIMHGSGYRRGAQVAGKKVLVIGAGESGADIAAEVADHAAEAVLSLRRGVAVVSRLAFGRPRDWLTSRLMNNAAHWVFQTRNRKDDRLRMVYKLVGAPVVVVDKLLQILYRQVWENLPMFWPPRPAEVKVKLRTRKLTMQLLAESGGTVTEQFGTKDDSFVRAMALGKLRRVGGVERFEGPRVFFEDGSSFEPELVLLCTGFETRAPFLEQPLVAAPRYLYTFNPEIGASLGFIGFARPAFGAIPPLAELQARWFALVAAGRSSLPSREMMEASVAQWAARRHHVFSAKEDRLSHLVDHTEYCDALAEQVGCKPRRPDLAKESRRLRKRFLAGPFVTAQYRLVGPGAKPELARSILENLPLAHPWPDRTNLWLRWNLCRFLAWLLGPAYAPKLHID
jgi:dimethylaniline monooxygenase (N-oxide forming)